MFSKCLSFNTETEMKSADIKPLFQLVCRFWFTSTFNGDKVFTLRLLQEATPSSKLDILGAFMARVKFKKGLTKEDSFSKVLKEQACIAFWRKPNPQTLYDKHQLLQPHPWKKPLNSVYITGCDRKTSSLLCLIHYFKHDSVKRFVQNLRLL